MEENKRRRVKGGFEAPGAEGGARQNEGLFIFKRFASF